MNLSAFIQTLSDSGDEEFPELEDFLSSVQKGPAAAPQSSNVIDLGSDSDESDADLTGAIRLSLQTPIQSALPRPARPPMTPEHPLGNQKKKVQQKAQQTPTVEDSTSPRLPTSLPHANRSHLESWAPNPGASGPICKEVSHHPTKVPMNDLNTLPIPTIDTDQLRLARLRHFSNSNAKDKSPSRPPAQRTTPKTSQRPFSTERVTSFAGTNHKKTFVDLTLED